MLDYILIVFYLLIKSVLELDKLGKKFNNFDCLKRFMFLIMID